MIKICERCKSEIACEVCGTLVNEGAHLLLIEKLKAQKGILIEALQFYGDLGEFNEVALEALHEVKHWKN